MEQSVEGYQSFNSSSKVEEDSEKRRVYEKGNFDTELFYVLEEKGV